MKSYPIFLSLLFTLLIVACNPECKDVDCGTTGNCLEGFCICEEGYYGPACSIRSMDTLLGAYNVQEVCDGDTVYYAASFADEGTSPISLNIISLNGRPATFVVAATLESTTSFSIDSQVVEGVLVWGDGTIGLSDNTATLNYFKEEAGVLDTCEAYFFP